MAKSGGTTKRQSEAARAKAGSPRAKRARAVADMLPDVGRAAFRRFGFVQSSVVSRWREIVGDRYATVSSPELIRFPAGKRSGGVLTLVVEGAHAPMMQHVAPVIVDRVNRFFGYPAVERISMRQGIVQVARARSRVAPLSLRALPAELGDSLRSIGDPELRACLESLARTVAANERADEAVAIPIVGRIGEERKK